MPVLAALSVPVEKRSLNSAAADKLREAIVTGAIAPGVRLTEVALASRMALSRGTIRAALHRLVTEGLVVQRPYAGWEVSSLTARDAWELYTLRGALEALAARLAAKNMDATKRHTLLEAFERLKVAAGSDDPKAITDADLGVHKTIVSLSGHRRLAEQYALVEHQVRMYIASTNARLPRRDLVVQEHEGFVQAVARGDADEAERLACEHSEFAGNDLVAHLERQERSRDSALASASDQRPIREADMSC
jgi:DNA-binding GntR family transcriptional regulator